MVVVILLTTPTIVFPQSKSKRITGKSPKASTPVRTDTFSTAPLDESLESLPANYRGNSFATIYNRLKLLPLSKSEYESSSQYAERLEQVLETALTGSLTGGSTLAFSYMNPGGLSFDSLEQVYDADAQLLNVTIKAGHSVVGWEISKRLDGSSLDYRSLTVHASPMRSLGSFVGTNSYGARVRVVKGEFDSHRVIFRACLKTQGTDLFGDRIRDELKASIQASPLEAMRLKSDLRALLVVKLIDPYMDGERSLFAKATVTRPSEFWVENRYLFVSLKAIWLYSNTTGKIYSKLRNCTGSR